jgi:hypothetical protein
MISIQELLQMLREAAIAPRELAPVVEVDPEHAEDFDPMIRARSAEVADVDGESPVHRMLNDYSRFWRQRRFRSLMDDGYDGIRIVSEGDSWFQYPIIRDDIIDHLSSRYAIYSLGRAGDTLDTIIAEQDDEIFPALKDHEPHFFLISGGGNDMVGNGQLAELVGDYASGREPADYAHTAAFDDFIDRLVGQYRDLFRRITGQYPEIEIVFHGYDAPIPGEDDRHLGAPLRSRGITDPALQVAVMQAIMRRYNNALAALAAEFDRVHHVDCMGSLRAPHWGDPMHPSSDGALRPAARINRRILDLSRARRLPLHRRPG